MASSCSRVCAVGALVLALWSGSDLRAMARLTPALVPQTAPAPVPPDRQAFNAALAIKDPAKQIDAIVKYATDFPDSETVYFAVARGMRTIGDADKDDVSRLRAFVIAVEAAMARATVPYRRADVYYNMAYRLVNRGVLPEDALRIASAAVPLLNQDAYIAIQHQSHDERESALNARTPSRLQEPFQMAEAVENFHGVHANYLSALGRAQLLTGHAREAEASLLASYTEAPVMETGMALAGMRDKAGKTSEALDFAMAAALTGKMNPPERATLEKLYARTHDGSTANLERDLDARYRTGHPSPLLAQKYAPTPARSTRVVLAEFVTGAACVPCVSVDLSWDAALARYARSEVALLVYHIHAPTSDPMSNTSVENRSHYYDVHAAPTLYLDGKIQETGEGGPTFATGVSKTLDSLIDARLEAPALGTVVITATRSDEAVRANVTVSGVPAAHRHVRLQLALVETEVSYSGENGLRFQPMVVRNLAGDGVEKGFLIGETGSLTRSYAFDLPAITRENLAYYDWYKADLKARANIDATFRELRYVMDPARLAVVAFLQDEDTKEVLQAAFVDLAHFLL